VFESPVRSGFLAPRALDRDRDRSLKSEIVKKTGPNRSWSVFCGHKTGLNRLWFRLVQNRSRTSLDRYKIQNI
jgi:hypothetical protein